MKPLSQLFGRILFYFLFFSFLFFISADALAAACCGGSASSSAIITGDQKAIFNTVYSWNDVVIDSVDSSGYWHTSHEHQKVQNLRLETSHIFWDQWQAGVSIPLISREKFSDTYSGLGDIATTIGYEYLPDWNYNPYRPHGVGFMTLTAPTGKSKLDSDVGGLDSRGNGLWALGFGTFLNKNWLNWDAVSSIEIHRSFMREVTSGVTLRPGYGGSLMLGGGYNWGNYRLGSSITWNYEDPIAVDNNFSNSDGYVERYATYAASLSYLIDDDWSGTFSYTDQTLFGNPLNTSLGRGVGLQFQRRWSR